MNLYIHLLLYSNNYIHNYIINFLNFNLHEIFFVRLKSFNYSNILYYYVYLSYTLKLYYMFDYFYNLLLFNFIYNIYIYNHYHINLYSNNKMFLYNNNFDFIKISFLDYFFIFLYILVLFFYYNNKTFNFINIYLITVFHNVF